MPDPFNLRRFVAAQDPVIAAVLGELAAGAKQTHWMWFIFPQIAGLGHSTMAQTYAISGRAEAAAYVAHPVLGPRLLDCTNLVNALTRRTAEQIFGPIDTQKFRSSMTLFAAVTAAPEFASALAKHFAGAPDQATLQRLTL